jgi:hypothetical protein
MNARQHADPKRWNFSLVNRLVDCVDSCCDELKMAWLAERRPDSVLHRSGGSNTRMPDRRAFSKRVYLRKRYRVRRCLFLCVGPFDFSGYGSGVRVGRCDLSTGVIPTPEHMFLVGSGVPHHHTLLLPPSPEGVDEKSEAPYKNHDDDGQEYDPSNFPDNSVCAVRASFLL